MSMSYFVNKSVRRNLFPHVQPRKLAYLVIRRSNSILAFVFHYIRRHQPTQPVQQKRWSATCLLSRNMQSVEDG